VNDRTRRREQAETDKHDAAQLAKMQTARAQALGPIAPQLCPRCGAEPQHSVDRDEDGTPSWWYVSCTRGGCIARAPLVSAKTGREAIAKWNRLEWDADTWKFRFAVAVAPV
jgi:hypothetical protein